MPSRAARAAAISAQRPARGRRPPRPAADRAARERQGDRQCRASRPSRSDNSAQRPALRRRRPLPLRWGQVASPVRGWWRCPPLGANGLPALSASTSACSGGSSSLPGSAARAHGRARAPGACARLCCNQPRAPPQPGRRLRSPVPVAEVRCGNERAVEGATDGQFGARPARSPRGGAALRRPQPHLGGH